MSDYTPWTEKYRPRSLKDVVGQKEIVSILRAYVKEKNMPNLLFAGPPVIDAARVICASGAGKYDISDPGVILSCQVQRICKPAIGHQPLAWPIEVIELG